MMGDLVRSFAAQLTHEMLHRWHRSLLASRAEMEDLGRYRTGDAPLQVVSGTVHSLRVHFEAPPASGLDEQMERFVRWFNRTVPDGDAPLPAVKRAGVAHLYFESIHPYEDGNGRIGRAISEKALGRPTLVALAATIILRRKAYYRALEAATGSNEITAWLRWFAGTAVEAQRRSRASVEFLIDKTKLLDRLRGQLNARQEQALLRVLREGPDGFAGGLSTGNYVTITKVSSATARRDLAGLVSKGALTKTGKRRYTRYHLAIPTRTVQPVVVRASGDVKSVEPA
ncbi:MAG: Fic family protein [Bryobacterales bacterium]|nr:Fic family protein [Bryobacterales bacterium]